jgi:DNA-binding transcriptional LysR family regulator
VTSDDLAAAYFVLREEGSGTRRTMLAALAAMGLALADLNVVVELGSTNAVVNAVASGAGISLVSTWALDCVLQTRRVSAVRLPGEDFTRNFHYLTRKKPLSRQVKAFVDWLERNRPILKETS